MQKKLLKKTTIKVILVFIILSILITSIANFIVDKDYLIKINGQKIKNFQIKDIFENEKNHQKIILGNKFYLLNENKNYINELYYNVLSNFIDEILIEQYVKKLKIYTTDNYLKNTILQQPIFQINKKFNNNKYLSIIKNTGFDTFQYINELRKKINIHRFLKSIASTEFILQNEINSIEKLITEKRIVRTAIINIKKIANIEHINKEEVNVFYEKNRDYFFHPEKFLISYIQIKNSDFKNFIKKSEIKYWYENHKNKYIEPEKNQYEIIYTNTISDAKEILKLINKNENTDVYLLLKKLKYPINTFHFENTDWIDTKNIPNIIEKAKLYKKNEISSIIPFLDKFLIIRLKNIKSIKIKNIKEVYNDIIYDIELEKLNYIQKFLKNNFNKNFEKQNKKFFEKIINTNFIDTEWFTIDDIPLEIHYDEIEKQILNFKKINLEKTIKMISPTKNNIILFYIKDHKKSFKKSFLESFDDITNVLKYKKAEKKAIIKAKEILVDLRKKKKIPALRFNYPKIISKNYEEPFSKSIFLLPKPQEKKFIYGIKKGSGKLLILSLESIFYINLSELQKESLLNNVLQNHIETEFSAILENLRKKSRINYNIKYINSQIDF